MTTAKAHAPDCAVYSDNRWPCDCRTTAKALREQVLTSAAFDVLRERERQVSVEGWTPEHDDEHAGGQMALAAVCYAMPTDRLKMCVKYNEIDNGRSAGEYNPFMARYMVPTLWPDSWHAMYWKPTDRRRDLVKAAALILAEIERIDRETLK